MSHYSPSCLSVKRRWIQKQLAKGLCVCCSKKALPTERVCQYHKNYNLKKQKRESIQNGQRQIIGTETSQLVQRPQHLSP